MIKINTRKKLLLAGFAVLIGFTPCNAQAGFVYNPEKPVVKKVISAPVKVKTKKLEMKIKKPVQVKQAETVKKIESVKEEYELSDTPVRKNTMNNDIAETIVSSEQNKATMEDVQKELDKELYDDILSIIDSIPAPNSEAAIDHTVIEDVSTPVEDPIVMAKVSLPEPKPMKRQYEVVEGFGNDLSLIIALRQIVPASYAFSFASDVDKKARTSWNGGKEWVYILSDILSENNMKSVIRNNVITISNIKNSAIIKEVGIEKIVDISTTAKEISRPVSYPVDMFQNIVRTSNNNGITISNAQEYKANDDVVIIEEISSEPARILDNSPVAPVARTWQARQNSSLSSILMHWSEIENVEAYIMTEEKYYIREPFIYKGLYAEAVNALLMSFSTYDPKPVGRLHSESIEGKPVLIIESN